MDNGVSSQGPRAPRSTSHTPSASVPTADQIRALRAEVVELLSRKVDGVYVAGTARWLAAELGGTTPKAIGFVQAVLLDMKREGLVTTRQHRSGELLWKITDQQHAKWQEQKGVHLGISAKSRN